MQCFATATAIGREMSYPQVFPRLSSILNLPSLGRTLVILCYWVIVAYMMTSSAIINDAYYWERIGFRNAWISVTQVPLVYMLASKSSIVGLIIGSSHERINWLHRWVSRTLLVTVTVHGYFFMAEWIRADFVKLELEMMPMVIYGIGAWAVLVWTLLTSISPLRRLAYEFFVLQHIVAAAVFLWLIWVHVPAYAQYNVWFAIVAVSFDWVLRGLLLVYRNFRIRSRLSCNGTQIIGHQVELQAVGNLTVVTIKDVHFSWEAGQHLYVRIPSLGPLESHPFTIATPYNSSISSTCNQIQLVVRAHSGFSKRLLKCALSKNKEAAKSMRCFVAGPYGTPPNWAAFESLILISASTGASFTLPILEHILSTKNITCTQRIHFLLVIRSRSHVQYYEQRLSEALSQAKHLGVELEVQIAITGQASSLHDSLNGEQSRSETQSLHSNDGESLPEADEKTTELPYPQLHLASRGTSISSLNEPGPLSTCRCPLSDKQSNQSCCEAVLKPSGRITYTYCRPNIQDFIRDPVEVTGGETSVVVCGGKSLVATVRNSVTRLSDERAVHKGTGAQGIHLHVEEYCF